MKGASSKYSPGRFISDGARNGAFNMAADLFFAEKARELKYPILRLYSWDKPTLSVGYHQKLSEDQLQQCLLNDVLVVRRPTGGRAVLHDGEITYCICIPENHEIYSIERSKILKDIGTVFVRAAGGIGLPAELVRVGERIQPEHKGTRPQSPLCFDSVSRWEVRLNGRKWIGSAQRFLPGVLLQHGSIMLERSELNISDLLNITTGESPDESVAFATEVREFKQDDLVSALYESFNDQWEIIFQEESISSEECGLIEDKAAVMQYDDGFTVATDP
ncbi:hypothetical protein CEE37_11045 [candidate division LCP-89 bacterium B3_LCP]|uniref:BPL/LPL catalytic domain-containing protein n=1 Tax=candidate division LCP-89 bacterium B3_LCP TaxID=2012998 RepID=A0A532UXZ8_UNCL8|nr:MAG: hypothetical protein CEE37_11045 [candidate division LCP-89 bacterium B3_LCP]